MTAVTRDRVVLDPYQYEFQNDPYQNQNQYGNQNQYQNTQYQSGNQQYQTQPSYGNQYDQNQNQVGMGGGQNAQAKLTQYSFNNGACTYQVCSDL